ERDPKSGAPGLAVSGTEQTARIRLARLHVPPEFPELLQCFRGQGNQDRARRITWRQVKLAQPVKSRDGPLDIRSVLTALKRHGTRPPQLRGGHHPVLGIGDQLSKSPRLRPAIARDGKTRNIDRLATVLPRGNAGATPAVTLDPKGAAG